MGKKGEMNSPVPAVRFERNFGTSEAVKGIAIFHLYRLYHPGPAGPQAAAGSRAKNGSAEGKAL